jgi:hypothetical protein
MRRLSSAYSDVAVFPSAAREDGRSWEAKKAFLAEIFR